MKKEKSFEKHLPSVQIDISEEHLSEFFETMIDRQKIFVNRFRKEKVYEVKDKILLVNKFTNVYRELDRNSQFQIKNILIDEPDISDKEIFWKLIFYRLFNNPETFQHLNKTRGYPSGIPPINEYDGEDFYYSIKQLRRLDKNPFTNAYVTNTVAFRGSGRDKSFCFGVIEFLNKNIDYLFYHTCKLKDAEKVIELFEEIPSVLKFMSHEFYQDLTYVGRYTDRTFFKWNQDDYTNIGPGCDMGLRIIFPSTKSLKDKIDKITELRDFGNEYLAEKGFDFLSWNKEKQKYSVSKEGSISLHQIEMWLCEYQKYFKMKVGEGKQRSKYKQDSKKDYSFYLY